MRRTQKLLDHIYPASWGAQRSFAGRARDLDLIVRGGKFERKFYGLHWVHMSRALGVTECEFVPIFSRSTNAAEGTSVRQPLKLYFSKCQKLQFSTSHSQASELRGVIEVPLAQTGEGIADCELLTWFVKEGDEVDEFQPLCSVQSDKATIQITSRYKGKVLRLKFVPGNVVKVGEPLLELVSGSSDYIGATQSLSKEQLSDAEEELLSTNDASGGHVENSQKKVLATPAIRDFAQQYGIKLEGVSGSGKDGRVLKEDVMKHISNKDGLDQELKLLSEIASRSVSLTHANERKESQHSNQKEMSDIPYVHKNIPEDKIIHVRGYQRTMVKAMTAAAAIPHFHLVDELNVDAVSALRKNLKDVFIEQGVNITYLPFVIKALSVALVKYPLVNSTCNEDASEICCRGAHNVGVAIATSYGLAVPNIKNVQDLSVLEIAKELLRLTELARANQLSSADVSGGTITVSNFGSVGGKFGSPLLNLPEVAIVAIGRIQKIPRFSDEGNIYPASIMNVTWGADHRVLDGATVANVCNEWKTIVERPERLVIHLK